MLDQWARIGGWDPDQLHRVAGPETVTLARGIIGRPADACNVCTGEDGDHQIGCPAAAWPGCDLQKRDTPTSQ
jgi:hypothetical protein